MFAKTHREPLLENVTYTEERNVQNVVPLQD